MGLFRFITRLFGRKGGKEREESASEWNVTAECMEAPEPEIQKEAKVVAHRSPSDPPADSIMEGWRGRLVLSSMDLMQIARKLQNKGEYYRAEQLLRDGVRNALQNLEYWWLLFEIEEPLNRKGRALYCLEQILQLNENYEPAIEKVGELKKLIDTDLSYFIEYKLAPEFYRLK